MAVLHDLLGGPVPAVAKRRRWRDARLPERPLRQPRRSRARVVDPVGDRVRRPSRSRTASSPRIEPATREPRARARPAFVDPHVHLRTPGREDEETIASGTAAAAAGGYCAILAMPNTDPVVDSAAVLGSLVEPARREALVPTGFMAAISKGLGGEELTEMAELADAGAAGVHRRRPAGRLGRADAPRAPVRRRHRPASSRSTARSRRSPATARCTKGAVSRRARLRRLAVGRRERDGRARPRARRLRGPAAPSDAPLRARVGRRAARGAGARASTRRAEVTPHHLVPHRRGRAHARPEHEDEPAAAGRRATAGR